MGEFHIKRIVLPSGKTVEIVYYQASDGERPPSADLRDIEAGAELHVRRLELCGGCGGERVHPTEWNEVEEMRWQLALRCPDCEWRHTDTYDAHEVERFDDVLNDATDRLIEELDRVTRENMNEAVDRFRSALESDGIMPFDFKTVDSTSCAALDWSGTRWTPRSSLARTYPACPADAPAVQRAPSCAQHPRIPWNQPSSISL